LNILLPRKKPLAMYKTILLLSFLFLFNLNQGQSQNYFQQKYNVPSRIYTWDLIRDSAIVAAGTESQGPFIYLTDATGQFLWTKGFVHGFDAGGVTDIKGTRDSGFIFIQSHDSLVITKTDQNGNIEWCNVYGDEIAFAGKLLQVSDSNYIVAYEKAVTGSLLKPALMKIDQFGDTLWTRTIDVGISYLDIRSFKELQDGTIALSYTLTYPDYASLILWCSTNGDLIAAHRYSNRALVYPEFDELSNGHIMVAGCITNLNDTTVLPTTVLYETDSSGTIFWSMKYLVGDTVDYPSLVLLNDSTFFLSCPAGYQILHKTYSGIYSRNGQLLNSQFIPEFFSFDKSFVMPDGGMLLCGGGSGPYITRTDNTGNFGCPSTSFNSATDSVIITSTSVMANVEASASLSYLSGPFSYYTPSISTVFQCAYDPVIDLFTNEINCYPVPFSDVLYIEMESGNWHIEIHDVSGKKVSEINEHNSSISVNTSAWNNGIYIVSIVSSDHLIRKRIIKM
jgi:hypothetical protein